MTQRDSLTIVHGRRMRSRASFLLVVLAVMDSGCAKTDSKEPPPRYTFEVKIATLPGVGGRLVLNGQTLHEFGAEGSEASSTDAACLFRAGENTLDWEIRHLAPDFEAKATNADSLAVALRSFDRPVVLIAGGRDKGQDFAPLAPLVKCD